MTSLPYSFLFNHLTEIDGVTWRPIDRLCARIKKALKGEDFYDVVKLKVSGTWRTYTSENRDELAQVVVATVGRKMAEVIAGNLSVVPIPNSGMADGVEGPFRIMKLANQFAAAFGGRAKVVDAIRWVEPKAQQHLMKGHRTPEMFLPLMRFTKSTDRQILIFDDVLTSGSQSIAAARLLREHGCEPTNIVTIAKAGKIQFERPFGWRTEELQIDEPGWEFDDL